MRFNSYSISWSTSLLSLFYPVVNLWAGLYFIQPKKYGPQANGQRPFRIKYLWVNNNGRRPCHKALIDKELNFNTKVSTFGP